MIFLYHYKMNTVSKWVEIIIIITLLLYLLPISSNFASLWEICLRKWSNYNATWINDTFMQMFLFIINFSCSNKVYFTVTFEALASKNKDDYFLKNMFFHSENIILFNNYENSPSKLLLPKYYDLITLMLYW